MRIKKTIFDIVLLLSGSYFILKPFYLWRSGLPQISDIVIALAILLFFISKGFRIYIYPSARNLTIFTFLFVMWIVLVNMVWGVLLYGSLQITVKSIYYLYNFFVLLFFQNIINIEFRLTHKIIYFSVIFSLSLQVILLIFRLPSSNVGRVSLFFNNPNQLAYNNLLFLSILILLGDRIEVKKFWNLIGIIFSTILVVVSMSKAGIISLVGILTFLLFFEIYNQKSFFKKILILFFLFFVTFLLVQQISEMAESSVFFRNIVNRFIIRQSDDSLVARGYDRILRFPEYLAFGAGEGDYKRFGYGIEIHSTFGNILMSYGVIGFILFGIIIFIVYKKSKFGNFYLMFFQLVYGLAHNGLRNTLFWILMVLITMNFSVKNDTYEIELNRKKVF
ncbi:hypothetical protein [Thermosipho sp. 1074]|uniref:hypothetical protein n=1 Tax=Thermosipho sp. 1074 TaxID=1643331 RepID=UPI000984BBB8|nr:hypothetical protein [Thermosipho sp. 1074]OOC44212.1 hypothetical protein XO08_04055 [Thermosipho sp. 1074]